MWCLRSQVHARFRFIHVDSRPRLVCLQNAAPSWGVGAQAERRRSAPEFTPAGMGKGGKKWYAVARGRDTGVFSTWAECKAQVNGYNGAVFQSFLSRSEAEAFSKGGRYRGRNGHGSNATNVKAPVFKHKSQTPRAVHSSIHSQTNGTQEYEAQMFFDGGSRGNPGPGGCGATVLRTSDESTITCGSAYLGHTTNNRAEYEGLILGLKIALDNSVRSIAVHGDSKLVVMQVNGRWQAHNAELAKLRDHVVNNLLPNFQRVRLLHVLRENNSEADRLANAAMDRAGAVEIPSES